MQPNGPQNYWQPQNEPAEPVPPVTPSPPQPVPQEPSLNSEQPIPSPQPPSPVMAVTPHEETFAPPKPSEETPQTVSNEALAEDTAILNWEASEYINHEKDGVWFLGFAVVVLVLLGGALWAQAWTLVVLTVIMAVATIVYTRRPPRTMRYSLSEHGLHIGSQFHAYNEYRAFGVIEDGPFYAIMLVSTKRFMPATLIYFAEQDGERVVDIFSTYLPMEDLDLDLADILIRRLRL